MSRSTRIRQARKQVAAMKRGAFSTGNKKTPGRPRGYDFSATGAPWNAPEADPNTPHAEVLSHEI